MKSYIRNVMHEVHFLEEGCKLLYKLNVDVNRIERWKKSCLLCLKHLKFAFKYQLTVSEKQRLLHAIGKVKCLHAKIDTLIKKGRGINQSRQEKKVRWIDIESAFQSRMRTGVIANLEHIDINNFLTDASILFSRRISRIFKQKNSTVEALKVNAVLSCQFKQELNNKGEKEENIEVKHFNTKNESIFANTPLKKWFIDHIKLPILIDVEEFETKDSG